MYRILAVLHVLFDFMYAYNYYMERKHLKEAVFRGIICLVMPMFGYFFFWLLDYFVRGNSKERMRNPYLGSQKAVDDFSLLRPIEKQEEINKVPVLEALAADDYRYRRKITMDTLKDEDIISYLPVLRRALENEGTETSYHTSAVITDAQKRVREYLTGKGAALEADPDDREVLKVFGQELFKVLFKDVFDERDTRKYSSVYQMVSDWLLKLEDRRDAYFHNRISVDLELGDINHAGQTCETFERECSDSENMVMDAIQLHIRVENREALDALLEELRHLPVFLTRESLQYIRSFSRSGEVET